MYLLFIDTFDSDEDKDFNVELRASQEEINEGGELNLTCEVPSGVMYIQKWLHPSKAVSVISFLFFFFT